MKTIIISLAILIAATAASAKTSYRLNGTNVTVESTSETKEIDPNFVKGAQPGKNDVKTVYTITKNGQKHEIWMNVNSRRHYYFVKVKTGPNAGKLRREYLPKDLDAQFK